MSDTTETFDLINAFRYHNDKDFSSSEKRAVVVGAALELIKHTEEIGFGNFDTTLDTMVKSIEKQLAL